MAFEIRKAERRKAKARVGLAGPSGSGKTGSALLLAYGITGDWSKIGVIDTENGSGELYVNSVIGGTPIGEYMYGRIEAPFTPQKYIEAMRAYEQAGAGCIIIDSLSHAWAGEGGLLDQQGKIADTSGNSWTAWRKITPQHNALVETMLQSKCHLVVTMRSKTAYVQQTNDRGKTEVKKMGMEIIQRDGMDYEFTVMLDLSPDHNAMVSKDRTQVFDGRIFRPTVEEGQALLRWLEAGSEAKSYSTSPAESSTEVRVSDDTAPAPNVVNQAQAAFGPQNVTVVPDQPQQPAPSQPVKAKDEVHPNKTKATEAITKTIAITASNKGVEPHAAATEYFKRPIESLYDIGKTPSEYQDFLKHLNSLPNKG